MRAFTLLSLASLATAGPIKGWMSDYLNKTMTVQSTAGVTAEELNRFEVYAEWSAASYCNSKAVAGSKITCTGTCPTLEGDGATIVAPLQGDLTGIRGFVGVDLARQEVVLSVRGSQNILNWLTNVDFGFEDCDFVDDCKVHNGFARAWDELYDQAKVAVTAAMTEHPGFRLMVVGHSLGGAVATIGATYLRRDGFASDIYTYGSPRVGNAAFVDFITAQAGAEFRVTHTVDPVPRLPPVVFGYRHTSPEYWLSNGESTQVDYRPEDILVCEGNMNTQCNGAGLVQIDIDAHRHYLLPISDCELVEAKRDELPVDEEALLQRLNDWALQDQAATQHLV
jgi:pimeloyl-ACP methyl ester carboxylesterase